MAAHGFAGLLPRKLDHLRRYSYQRRGQVWARTAVRAYARRAGNGTRTRDPNLGKVVLYQLSYSRETERILVSGPPRRNDPRLGVKIGRRGSHGGEGDRTPDLVNAIHALSQLSYAPVTIVPPSNGAAAARKRTPRISECQRGQRPHRGHSRRIEGYSCSHE